MPMTKVPFNGVLNSNELFSSIFNMIISQEVNYPSLNAKITSLVDKYRVDGTLFGDTKLFYDTDVLGTTPWTNYGTGTSADTNLLVPHRPDDPKCQAITIDTFRQVAVTVDSWLTKRAWSTEGAFTQFNGIMVAMLSETKKIHESTLFGVYVGTQKSTAPKATVSIDVTTATTGLTGNDKNRVEAQVIAQGIADLFENMADYSRDFNDYKFMRAWSEGQLQVIANSKFINKLTKLDLPTIFHKDGLLGKLTENVINSRYFGHVASASDAGAGKVINGSDQYDATKGTLRFVQETYVTLGGESRHFFSGDAVPTKKLNGTTALTVTVGASKDLAYSQVYVEDANVICKIVSADTYKFMGAFSVGTEFYNAQNLSQNHYLTFGYSQPDYLRGQPLVTVEAV